MLEKGIEFEMNSEKEKNQTKLFKAAGLGGPGNLFCHLKFLGIHHDIDQLISQIMLQSREI